MISLIIPTLGERIGEITRLFESLDEQNPKSGDLEVIVISQDNHEDVAKALGIMDDRIIVKHVKLNRRGLSHARNVGLRYVTGSIVAFGDDDCWYPANVFEKVETIVRQHEIVAFEIYDYEDQRPYKNYRFRKETTHMNPLLTFGVSSIEIFINLQRVSIRDIVFDENMGLGAKYPSGEENDLLIRLVRKGYSITHIPEVITYHTSLGSRRVTRTESGAKLYFFRKNFGPIYGVLLFWLLVVRNATKELLAGC